LSGGQVIHHVYKKPSSHRQQAGSYKPKQPSPAGWLLQRPVHICLDWQALDVGVGMTGLIFVKAGLSN
jgi:hypothetical protein